VGSFRSARRAAVLFFAAVVVASSFIAPATPSVAAAAAPPVTAVALDPTDQGTDSAYVAADPSQGSEAGPALSTDVAELRTATSRTFARTDGTYCTELSPDPINYRPVADAAWNHYRPI
jgi:hypothetical protein